MGNDRRREVTRRSAKAPRLGCDDKEIGAAECVKGGNPGWYGGTGRGPVLVLGWAALRACQDAGKAAYEAQCNEGRFRAQYCKSTRGNLRLVLSRAGKSKSTSRDSTQRTHQSKSGEHGEWLPFARGLWVAMIVRQPRWRTEVRRYKCNQRFAAGCVQLNDLCKTWPRVWFRARSWPEESDFTLGLD
jgi:hypothetical protein